MSKHTPGPWEVMDLDGRKYYGTTVRLSDGAEVTIWGSRAWKPSQRELMTWGPKPDDETEQEFVSNIMCDGHYEDELDLANARLIAAAPELYRELRALVNALESALSEGEIHVPGLATLNAARLALAKAEGK